MGVSLWLDPEDKTARIFLLSSLLPFLSHHINIADCEDNHNQNQDSENQHDILLPTEDSLLFQSGNEFSLRARALLAPTVKMT
ncbi:MAG: hypothetical protein F4148_02720 [Caldilineaceae bacterium SB0675_bin_29]|uniref:Uncharacterized protein n=1 Tax=Caldilineaceae bacterium SB0675_bin_29 TaxID=2605266 RepID=A0A6B1FXB2_9CHLR|nr:hypothetical protein [Caldilineaceae bacterium SB0675_bin_29]